MRTVITLFVFLIVGLVGSRGFVARATRRFPLSGLLVSGMEFLLLGILFGPSGLAFITPDVLLDLEPVIYLSLGWIGLLVGIELSWRHVRTIARPTVTLLVIDTLSTLAVVLVSSMVALSLLFDHIALGERITSSVILGITAAISSPTMIALMSNRLPARGPFTNTVKVASSLSPVFPLMVFGLLFTLMSRGVDSISGIAVGVMLWVFVNVVGVVLGLVMVLFTRERCSADEMLLLVIGTVLLIGGMCYFLGLSSLYMSVIMGFIVGNLSRKRDLIFNELHVMEKTIFFAFLVLVGAMLDFTGGHFVYLATGYVGVRLVAKRLASGRALMNRFPEFRPLGTRAGMVFSAQGGMAMAIAMDYALASDSVLAPIVLSTVAVGVVINDVFGLLLTKRTLEASGEVILRRNTRPTGGAE